MFEFLNDTILPVFEITVRPRCLVHVKFAFTSLNQPQVSCVKVQLVDVEFPGDASTGSIVHSMFSNDIRSIALKKKTE